MDLRLFFSCLTTVIATVLSEENLSRSLPQALIIGVKKGGTRALLEYLRLHPDVRAPGPEIHFFDRHYDRGVDWYRRQMPLASPNQLTIEKTPSYYITKDAPRRIYDINPAMKLLVVVRNPVTRAISDYTQTVSKRPGMKSFEEMVFKDPLNGVVNTSWGAVKIGLYYRHLKRWLKYFPADQFMFVSGELLISDPAAEMQRVERFLALKPAISAAHFHFNPTKGFPCLSRNISNASRPQLHCLGKTKGRAHPHISPDVIGTLASFFEPFNRRFYALTGRNFGW